MAEVPKDIYRNGERKAGWPANYFIFPKGWVSLFGWIHQGEPAQKFYLCVWHTSWGSIIGVAPVIRMPTGPRTPEQQRLYSWVWLTHWLLSRTEGVFIWVYMVFIYQNHIKPLQFEIAIGGSSFTWLWNVMDIRWYPLYPVSWSSHRKHLLPSGAWPSLSGDGSR